MERKAFTLRLPEQERTALEDLSRIEGRPVNQLLNEAVRHFLARQGPREQDLAASLDRLRSYRERDPSFATAIASVVETESSLRDPLKETIIRDGQPGSSATGPVQTRIHELLRA